MGLTLTYAINLMGLFQWGVRQSAEVENQVCLQQTIFYVPNLRFFMMKKFADTV